MIGISKLYCGTVEPSDVLRYSRRSSKLPSHLLQFSEDKKPVVVWNVSRRCNLRCRHCYSNSADQNYDGELSTEEGVALLDDLADYGVPVILFSGGEPLLRPDIFKLVEHARFNGMRAVISTNGTLITAENAARFKEIGLSYIGVSLDGVGETNDHFRGKAGAFNDALQGIRFARAAGVKVGLRFTISRHTVNDIDLIFDLLESENIPRVCFYHLVYSGRGNSLAGDDLSHAEARVAINLIMDRTRTLHDSGNPVEVLTVDNHCDGPYLYLRLKEEDPEHAAKVLDLLQMNGGNGSGQAIGCVSWDGTVYPDQFWRNCPLGNVRERPFSGIWSDASHPVLSLLRRRKEYLKGRCRSCRWLAICNGNLRARAQAASNDMWAQDPACYLTDEEIKQ